MINVRGDKGSYLQVELIFGIVTLSVFKDNRLVEQFVLGNEDVWELKSLTEKHLGIYRKEYRSTLRGEK